MQLLVKNYFRVKRQHIKMLVLILLIVNNYFRVNSDKLVYLKEHAALNYQFMFRVVVDVGAAFRSCSSYQQYALGLFKVTVA